MNCRFFTTVIVSAAALPASAQSFNIEWGSTGTSPPSSYAA